MSFRVRLANKGTIFFFGSRNRIKKGWKQSNKYDRNTITGDMALNKDFKEFIELLNKNEVKYLIVDSIAA